MSSTKENTELINLNSSLSQVGTEKAVACSLNAKTQAESILETNKLCQIDKITVSQNSTEINPATTQSG